MSIVEGFRSLVGRAGSAWPHWRCIAVEANTGNVCGLKATHRQAPIPRSNTTWLFCERHAPAAAELIPPDAPYYVTRLELRVAVSGPPGDRAEAADEAVRRIVNAIEAAGGLLTGLRVPGRKASAAAAESPPLRLELAGKASAAGKARSWLAGAPDAAPWPRFRRRRTG